MNLQVWRGSQRDVKPGDMILPVVGGDAGQPARFGEWLLDTTDITVTKLTKLLPRYREARKQLVTDLRKTTKDRGN